jgi:hypothetical protein
MEQIGSFFKTFGFVPTLAMALYAAIIYRKLPGELKLFSWFVFLSGIIEAVSRIYWVYGKNNMPLLHIYVAVGFVCLALFYQRILKGVINRNLITIVLVLFLIFTIINSLFIQPVYTFNSYALTVEGIIIVVLSLSTYIFMMDSIVKQNRGGIVKSLDWINTGLFMYYASSLLIFHYGNFITLFAPSYLVEYTWILHAFFSCIMYCCFFVGIWNRPRN